MKRLLSTICLLGLCLTAALGNNFLEGEPFASGQVGALAVNLKGDTLLSINPRRMIYPASNVKLVTCGAALVGLETDYQFRMAISYSGRVNGSTLDGDLYLVGDGDPTLGAKYPSSRAMDSVMDFIYAQLDEAGITSINGAVIADGRCYASDTPNWDTSVGDGGFYYGASVQGLNYRENTLEYSVSHGMDGTIIARPERQQPWLKFECTATTGGKGDRLLYEASRFTPHAVLSGTLGAEIKSKRERCTDNFPAYAFAADTYAYLREVGVSISDGYADVASDGTLRRFSDQKGSLSTGRKALDVGQLVTMGRLGSPLLPAIVSETLHHSDNFYAEALLKALGAYFRGSGNVHESLSVQNDLILKIAGSTDGAVLVDGSGLSRRNCVSPVFLVRFLSAMTGTDCWDEYLAALPGPGEGTLASRLPGVDAATRARVKMKSGSAEGVRCYSGYILPREGAPKDETVVFSILTGNLYGDSAAIYSAIDKTILSLAR